MGANPRWAADEVPMCPICGVQMVVAELGVGPSDAVLRPDGDGVVPSPLDGASTTLD